VQIARNGDLVVEKILKPDKVHLLSHRDQRQEIAQSDMYVQRRSSILFFSGVFFGRVK